LGPDGNKIVLPRNAAIQPWQREHKVGQLIAGPGNKKKLVYDTSRTRMTAPHGQQRGEGIQFPREDGRVTIPAHEYNPEPRWPRFGPPLSERHVPQPKPTDGPEDPEALARETQAAQEAVDRHNHKNWGAQQVLDDVPPMGGGYDTKRKKTKRKLKRTKRKPRKTNSKTNSKTKTKTKIRTKRKLRKLKKTKRISKKR